MASKTLGDELLESIILKKDSAASVAKSAKWSSKCNNKELTDIAAKAKEAGVSYGNYVMGNVYKAFNPAFEYAKGYTYHKAETCLSKN